MKRLKQSEEPIGDYRPSEYKPLSYHGSKSQPIQSKKSQARKGKAGSSEKMTDFFAPPNKHLGWADKAFDELEILLTTFGQETGSSLIKEFNPETREHIGKIKLHGELPDDVGRKATEVLLHCRHSFDQSLHAVIRSLGRKFDGTAHYPWCTNPKDLEGKIKTLKGKIKGKEIPEELWEVIRKQQPYGTSDAYPGGNDLVRDLAKVANSKHDVGIETIGHVASLTPPSITAGSFEQVAILLPKWDPVKNEVAVYSLIGAENVKVRSDYTLNLHIVIHDTRLRSPVRVLGSLADFRDFAKRVLQDFEAFSA